jgi:hypothetical protein
VAIAPFLLAPGGPALSGVTYDKDGAVLGSCHVFVFKDNGDDTLTFIGHATSNATTGAWSVTTPDTDDAYIAYAFKDDSPHVFDVTYRTCQPE